MHLPFVYQGATNAEQSTAPIAPTPHERALEAVAIQATTAFLVSEITYKLLSKVKRALVEDYHVFIDALKLSLSDPGVSTLFDNMKKQRDKIWELGETVDRIRPSLINGMRCMFPENPPEYGVATYTPQTGEQHPVNDQLLQELDNITYTLWRKGPSKKKRPFESAITPTTTPAKRHGSPLQSAIAKRMKPTLLATGRLTPPTASFDLSDTDDEDLETPDGEEDAFDDQADEEEQLEIKEEMKEETAEETKEKTEKEIEE